MMIWRKCYRRGLSLVEVVLATAILGVVAVTVVAYVHQPAERVKRESCNLRIQQLNVLAKQYMADHGRWPNRNLRELTDARYLGEPIPRCPVDNRPFVFNRRTGEVVDHAHP